MTTRNLVSMKTTGMTYQGYALARPEGKPTFVRYALPEEHVWAEIDRDKGSYATATTRVVDQQSPERSTPPCPYFGPEACGGCQWQHAIYEAQLRYKTGIVAEQFARIGRLPSAPVMPTMGSTAPYGYRTHATFTATDHGQLAFVGADERSLQPIDHCLLLRPALNELLHRLLPVDFSGAKRVRLQAGSADDDLAVVLYGTLRQPEQVLRAAAGVSVVEMKGEHSRVLQGKAHLTYLIAEHRFRATAGGFFQVNLAQAEALVALVTDLLPQQRSSHALDLYAGVGLFSAFLAPRSNRLTSIEQFSPALADARNNLANNAHVHLIEGAVEQVMNRVQTPVDFVVTDPPRAGMKPAVLDWLGKHHPARIVYVSCDPSTLARDTRVLIDQGYTLTSVQPVDMFPQTYHIECVACFDYAS